MAIIPRQQPIQTTNYVPGVYSTPPTATGACDGITPITVDLSAADYLQGTLYVPATGYVYVAWGDTVSSSTATYTYSFEHYREPYVDFHFGASDPLPVGSNLSFLTTVAGGDFVYQTAQKVEV